VSNWLGPLSSALAQAREPVEFFFRDDDAGWDDERLMALLDAFQERGMPLDLAVIPRALSRELARVLTARATAWDGRLGLHQHGLAHVNHEPDGRKGEFGPARSPRMQRDDLVEGRTLLDALLPGLTLPLFTPPWNRCTAATAELLVELGFRALSRDTAAPQFGMAGLIELPVSVDWSYARRAGSRLTWVELGQLAGDRVRLGGPVGVNLHHAVMDGSELALVCELCDLLGTHERVRCHTMQSLLG
jgi:hypothetical protein